MREGAEGEIEEGSRERWREERRGREKDRGEGRREGRERRGMDEERGEGWMKRIQRTYKETHRTLT